VLVLKAGYTGLWQRDIQAGDGNVDLVLRRSGQIEGVVVRADTGAPVAEFSVSNILGTRARMTPALSENATHIHDEQGRFSLTDVEQGEVTVAIMASGFATTFQTVEVELGEAPATLVVVRLEPESVVHGRVVDKSAQPIAGVLIGVGKIPRDESGCVRDALTRTDDDGAFQLDGQGPSETIVWAFHPNYVSESTAFAPAQRRGNDIEMVLRRGAIIEGAVRKGGRTAVGASISADNRKFTQQSDGTYRLSGLSPGLLSVRAQFGDPAGHIGYFTMEKQVLVESGDTAQVNFDFIEGNAEIEVYLTAEGQTPRRAEVIVTLWSENGEKILCRVNEYNTDYCRLSGLPAGRLSLEVKVSAVSGTEYKRVIEVDSQAGYTTTLELGLPDEVRTKARDQ
jgi:hypothetical protein